MRASLGLLIPHDRYYAILWVDRTAAEAAFAMEGAFNDAVISLAPGADALQVIEELDRLLEPYGALGAIARRDQPSHRFLDDELNKKLCPRQFAISFSVLPLFYSTLHWGARREGELARSGTINAGDTFEIRATATAGESTYAGIVRHGHCSSDCEVAIHPLGGPICAFVVANHPRRRWRCLVPVGRSRQRAGRIGCRDAMSAHPGRTGRIHCWDRAGRSTWHSHQGQRTA